MRIIKLQVETIVDRTIQFSKYAVSLDRKRYTKISHFIKHVKKVCSLYDGFIIPNNEKSKVLQEGHIYKLTFCRQTTKKDEQIEPSQVESSQKAEQNCAISKVNKNDRSNAEKKPKVRQKLQKIKRKNQNKSSSMSDSDESSNSSSQEQQEQAFSSSSSDQSEPNVIKKVTMTIQPKNSVSQVNKRQVRKQPPRPLIKKDLPDRSNPKISSNKKNPFISRKVQSSPSSSSSSLEKMPINQPKPTVVFLESKANQSKAQNPVKQVSSKNPKKPAVIADSSSQSEPSQTPPMKRPHPSTKNAAQQQNSQPIEKPNPQPKLPPALRNKFVKKNFDEHKQNQWIAIDKQSLKKWYQLGNATVCQANNKIRFKIVELDEQKFIPVKSGWITGEVKAVLSGVVSLVKVEQEGKPYQQKYEIPQHNMDELQLNRLLATKQQIQFLQPKQSKGQQQQSRQDKKGQNNQQKPGLQGLNDKSSIQKYICGQANYYFSDKNYNFDLFMQMHANRHPQKYLSLYILLNFPKIKKVLHDKQKLYQYLQEDEKYSQRSYQIDFQNHLIRKKGIAVQESKEGRPEDGEAAQSNPPHQ